MWFMLFMMYVLNGNIKHLGIFWLKQISETSSFHSFWFEFEGMNHLRSKLTSFQSEKIPQNIHENWEFWPGNSVGELFWMVKNVDPFKGEVKWPLQTESGIFSRSQPPWIHPPKLETPIPRVFSECKKNAAVRCWHARRQRSTFFARLRVIASCSFWWGSFIWILRSVGRRTKRCCTPSSMTRLGSCGEFWPAKGWKNQQDLKNHRKTLQRG